jgi:hypothetical protein
LIFPAVTASTEKLRLGGQKQNTKSNATHDVTALKEALIVQTFPNF